MHVHESRHVYAGNPRYVAAVIRNSVALLVTLRSVQFGHDVRPDSAAVLEHVLLPRQCLWARSFQAGAADGELGCVRC